METLSALGTIIDEGRADTVNDRVARLWLARALWRWAEPWAVPPGFVNATIAFETDNRLGEHDAARLLQRMRHCGFEKRTRRGCSACASQTCARPA